MSIGTHGFSGKLGGSGPDREREGGPQRFGLVLPERPAKPREEGLTIVLDRGYGPRALQDLLDSAADLVDFVKFGWGTGAVTGHLQRKTEILRERDVGFFFGGTLLEAYLLQGNLDGFRRFLNEMRPSVVEISDGVVEFRPGRKQALIELLGRDRPVFSEVGKKDSGQDLPADQWIDRIRSDLQAGARKVLCESRESGGVGIFSASGDLRTDLIQEIVTDVPPTVLVFEAPRKAAQVWLVKEFGPNVNLGNITFDDVVPLETLRLGLRADTLGTSCGSPGEKWIEVPGDDSLGGAAP